MGSGPRHRGLSATRGRPEPGPRRAAAGLCVPDGAPQAWCRCSVLTAPRWAVKSTSSAWKTLRLPRTMTDCTGCAPSALAAAGPDGSDPAMMTLTGARPPRWSWSRCLAMHRPWMSPWGHCGHPYPCRAHARDLSSPPSPSPETPMLAEPGAGISTGVWGPSAPVL